MNKFFLAVVLAGVVYLFTNSTTAAAFVFGGFILYTGNKALEIMEDREGKDFFKEGIEQLKRDIKDNSLKVGGYLMQKGTKDIEVDGVNRGRILGVVEGSYLVDYFGDREYASSVKKIKKSFKDVRDVYLVLYENYNSGNFLSWLIGYPKTILMIPKDRAEILNGNVYIMASSLVTMLDIKVPNDYVNKLTASNIVHEQFLEQLAKGNYEDFGWYVAKRADYNVNFLQAKKTGEVDIKPNVEQK